MLVSLSCFFLIIGVILMALYFILIHYSNSLIEDRTVKNHIRNSFAYQYYMNCSMGLRLFLYIVLGLSCVMMGLGITFFISMMKATPYLVFIAVLFPLSFLFLYFSNILSLNYYKLHLISSIGGFFFFSAACILSGIGPFISKVGVELTYFSKPVMVVVGVVGAIAFLALINPKLTNWAKMEKAEENGKTIYVKPKVNFYALYEWVYLILLAVVSLLFFINIIVQNLLTF